MVSFCQADDGRKKMQEVLELRINGVAHDGSGVARHEGIAVFVDGALPDEYVKAEIVEAGKSFLRARSIEVLEPSPMRRIPFCPYYGECGGCNMQHASYDYQLELKRHIVSDAMERIGRIKGVEVRPVIGMDMPFNYRNKAEFRVWLDDEGRKTAIGFRRRSSHDSVDVRECRVVPQACMDAINSLRVSLNESDPNLKQAIKHAVVRVGDEGSMMMILVSTEPADRACNKLAEALMSAQPHIVSVYHSHSRRRFGDVLQGRNTLLAGADRIHYNIGGHSFMASPSSFFQVNQEQAEKLYKTAVELAAVNKEEAVLDLYCGIGTITLMLAEKASKAMGIEINVQAVDDARQSAVSNGISNACFMAGKSEDILASGEMRVFGPAAVVLDPPRTGCDPQVMSTLIGMGPKRIVYISCDPATMARDAALLVKGGYGVRAVQPVDMFPHTSHVETVVLMSRVKD